MSLVSKNAAAHQYKSAKGGKDNYEAASCFRWFTEVHFGIFFEWFVVPRSLHHCKCGKGGKDNYEAASNFRWFTEVHFGIFFEWFVVRRSLRSTKNLHYLASFRYFHNGAVAKNYIDQLQSGPVESRLEPSSSIVASS